MKGPEVLIVRTGTANLASVIAAFERLQLAPRVSDDPADIETARLLVLPGVGTLASSMQKLEAHRLVEPLRCRIQEARPTLAICLGLQMLCEGSEESPGVRGIGAVSAHANRFPQGVRVPQLGWNRIEPEEGCDLLSRDYVYFANSFRIEQRPEGWRAAFAEYGGRFVAALERGNVLACQFHPELSGRAGLALIRRWLERSLGTLEERGCAC